MNELEKWLCEFNTLVPTKDATITPNEATFYCLQGVAFMIDKMVNVGYRGLLGVGDSSNEQKQEQETCWMDVNELCRRHPELRKSNVQSRQWRLANNFPCKGAYKCRQMYYDPDVIGWINQHIRGENC